MKALYRRYRPRTLAEVVGQEQITTVLKKSISSGDFSHAYLFIGPRGTGKTSIARILAHEINQFDYELEDDYLDIIEIDAASNTGVDDIRSLRENIMVAPSKGKYKVYIIDEVHMLSKSAFNALLKTLEEPPEHVVFIMATTDAQKVPITISSRSQVFNFKLADPSTMLDHVKNICKKEKIKIDDEALKIIIRRGGGSFRDTLSILDQAATLSDDTITADILTQTFGLPQEAVISQILHDYISGDIDSIRKQLTQLAESGVSTESLISDLIDSILAQSDTVKYLPLLEKLSSIRTDDSYKNARVLLALCSNAVGVAPIVRPPVIKAAEPAKIAAAPSLKKPEAKAAPKPPEPAPKTSEPAVVVAKPDATATEIWQLVCQNVAAKAPNCSDMINKSNYTLENDTLTVYTGNPFYKKMLESRRNLIAEVIPPNVTLEINDKKISTDPELANIMEVMGGGEEIEIDA